MRENIGTANRQKRDEANASRIERKNSKSRVLHSVSRGRFVSETVPNKRKRYRVKEDIENITDRIKERIENRRTEKKQKRDEGYGSTHNDNCSTKTKRCPELVSANVCRKQKNKCNKLRCVDEENVRFKQKTKMCQKKSRDLGTHKESTNCKPHSVKYKQNAKNFNGKVSIIRDEANGSRHNCSTKTKTSPELVSPNLCRKQKNKHNELCCVDEESVRFKQKQECAKKIP